MRRVIKGHTWRSKKCIAWRMDTGMDLHRPKSVVGERHLYIQMAHYYTIRPSTSNFPSLCYFDNQVLVC